MSVTFTDDLGVTDEPDRFTEAVKAFRRRVPMTDEEFAALDVEESSRAFRVANVAQADLVQEIFDGIERAIDQGQTFEDFKAGLADRLEEGWADPGAARLETVFRTNTLTSYNAGRHEIFTRDEVAEARPYWQFRAIEDDRVDDECIEADGVVLPMDDPWWQAHIPPLHFNCRCTYVALTEDEAAEEGVTTKPPAAEADEGFGAPPEDDPWEPDLSGYEPDLRDALVGKLG